MDVRRKVDFPRDAGVNSSGVDGGTEKTAEVRAYGGAAARLAEATRAALRERGWSLRQAEGATGVKYSTVFNMFHGRNVEPEHLIAFARAIGEDPDRWLKAAGKPYRMAAGAVRLPLITRVAAGTPPHADGNAVGFVSVPGDWLAPVGDGEDGIDGAMPVRCFALLVRGDGMIGADVRDGDLLAARAADGAEPGQVVVARLGEEVAVRRLRLLDGNLHLCTDSEDDTDPVPLGPDTAVIGIPVGYLRHKPPSWY